MLFGSGICEKHGGKVSDPSSIEIASPALTTYRCRICGKKSESSWTPGPKICNSCEEITGRCRTCGKLLNN